MKNNVRRTFAIALTAIATFAAALQLAPQDQIIKVDYEYKDEEGRTCSILGMADITADSVSCWDTSGKISEELNAKVADMLRRSNSTDLSFRYGKKNRFLIVQADKADVYYSWRSDNDSNFQMVYNLGSNSSIQLYRCTKDSSDKMLSLSLSITNNKQNSTEIPLVKDQKSSIGKVTMSFSSCVPIEGPPPSRDTNQPYHGKFWKVILSVDGIKDPYFPYNNLTANGQDGAQILYVDMNGKPVPGKTYLEDPYPDPNYGDPRMPKPDTKKHKYARAVVLQGLYAQGAVSLYTNIDPQVLKALSVKWNTTKTIKFADVPLDPK